MREIINVYVWTFLPCLKNAGLIHYWGDGDGKKVATVLFESDNVNNFGRPLTITTIVLYPIVHLCHPIYTFKQCLKKILHFPTLEAQ